jgi:hypothetical protein
MPQQTRTWPSLALVAALTATACGCTDTGKPKDYEPLAHLVAKADRVTLYEGLPHQDERQLFEQEMAAKPTIEIHEFRFYERTLPLTPDDITALRGIFAKTETFQTYGGGKKCGGFHPDYCVEWGAGDSQIRLLICFGCDEAKVYGPSASLHFDLSSSANKRLNELLGERWQERPKSELAKMVRRS